MDDVQTFVSKSGFSSHVKNIQLDRRHVKSSEPDKCTFDVYLTARYMREHRCIELSINLDKLLGNHIGRFVWGQQGFSKSTHDAESIELSFRYEYSSTEEVAKPQATRRTILNANLMLPDGSWLNSSVDLNDHIALVQKPEGGWELAASKLPRARTIIMCFDGTGNQFDDTNTNVVHLMKSLQKSDPRAQQVYYQEGIGTYAPPGFWTSLGLLMAKGADSAFAWYLEEHVMAGYRYLCNTYQNGDKIFIFGFSRGAHTARAVAGMLDVVGLIPANNAEHIPFAYSLYQNATTEQGLSMATKFKQTFSEPVTIDFLGLWDTVNSQGFIRPRSLPHTDFNPSVTYFRHALSLDERRVKFLPSVLNAEAKYYKGTKTDPPQVKECWFAGDHCDVGGGWETDNNHYALSNIPLRWMIKECIACDPSILFKAGAYPVIHPRIYMRVDDEGTVKPGLTYEPKHSEEHQHVSYEAQVIGDLKSPRHDAPSDEGFFVRLLWKVTEWVPMLAHVPRNTAGVKKVSSNENALDTKAQAWYWNRGRGRKITMDNERPLLIHYTVKTLLESDLPPLKIQSSPNHSDAESTDNLLVIRECEELREHNHKCKDVQIAHDKSFKPYESKIRFMDGKEERSLDYVVKHMPTMIEWEDERNE